jgi:hypothetical protein
VVEYKYYCLGGPFDKEFAESKLARDKDYIQFNCSSGGYKSKRLIDRAKRRGIIPVPSMVFIHLSLFKDVL